MRTIAVLMLALAALAWGETPAPSRDEMAAVERSMYEKMLKFNVEAPADVLGLPRGIYLDGFGVVFTAEFSPLVTPGISPFRPVMSKEQIAQIRAAKEQRMPQVRAMMRQMLVDAASTLDRLPKNEQVVLGMVMFYTKWEDRGRMPRVITMHAEKGVLLDVAANRSPAQALEKSITVREE
jgi:hypothetical protein